ncbi:L-threonylcarbamoyladenylate synthase [Radiobacillus sp. PE A8.2]|uniref:L-threonylcarbamoyladenylate synthase n=1 Tax=Radiobacillus sp. PE A8.2 TaxID=3380349 RepID=UPI00388FCB4B
MQTTKQWKVDLSISTEHPAILEAAELLQKEQVIAFPTETVYGLGANASNERAVSKIFEAKGRPSDNPLIVHVANAEQINHYVTTIPEVAKQLIEAFMPGPLTIILPSNGTIAQTVTAGLSTIAIRIPDHPVAQALLKATQLPLAAPSANRSGRPSPTTAAHVHNDLDGRIAGILDAGPTGVGVESTVVDCTSEVPTILRPGGITLEQLEQVVGAVNVDPALLEGQLQPKSPGMKYNHYQPEVPLWLIDGDEVFMQSEIDKAKKQGNKVGAIISNELAQFVSADHVRVCGSRQNLSEVAVHLYDALRAFHKSDVDIIFCETFPQTGIGQAIMNRLTKAATSIIKQ